MSLLSGLRMLNKQEITFGKKKKLHMATLQTAMTTLEMY